MKRISAVVAKLLDSTSVVQDERYCDANLPFNCNVDWKLFSRFTALDYKFVWGNILGIYLKLIVKTSFTFLILMLPFILFSGVNMRHISSHKKT